jgi:hypothetical protein
MRFGTDWSEVEIVSGPDVILTIRGYAPVVTIKDLQTCLEFVMYIAAKSLAEPLESLRADNAGQFVGLKLRIRKQSSDRTAPYEVQRI